METLLQLYLILKKSKVMRGFLIARTSSALPLAVHGSWVHCTTDLSMTLENLISHIQGEFVNWQVLGCSGDENGIAIPTSFTKPGLL